MHFFLDTSALFKLFVQEDHSERYLALLQDEPTLYVSQVAWVEFHSALRKQLAMKGLSTPQCGQILEQLKKDWKTYLKVRMDDETLEAAASLVNAHSLRTLDAIQLASALSVRPYLDEPLIFL